MSQEEDLLEKLDPTKSRCYGCGRVYEVDSMHFEMGFKPSTTESHRYGYCDECYNEALGEAVEAIITGQHAKIDSNAILQAIDPDYRRCPGCHNQIYDPNRDKPILPPLGTSPKETYQCECQICGKNVAMRYNKKTGKVCVLKFQKGILEKEIYG